MNIKKALLVTLSTGLIATTLVNTNYVNAEGTEEIPKETSEVKVKFSMPDSYDTVNSLNPRDPDDEENIDEKDVGKETEQTGPLTLDIVSDIEFGSQTVEFDGGEYESETEIPYIQVTDIRGPGDGWEVTAKADQFYNGNENSLYGAEIHLSGGEAVKRSDNYINQP